MCAPRASTIPTASPRQMAASATPVCMATAHTLPRGKDSLNLPAAFWVIVSYFVRTSSFPFFSDFSDSDPNLSDAFDIITIRCRPPAGFSVLPCVVCWHVVQGVLPPSRGRAWSF